MTTSNKRPVRSYILRQGRLTKHQERGIKNFSSKYAIPFQKSFLNFDQVFPKRNKVILEIGFGMGDSLLEMVSAEPDKDFIGIEVHPPGVGRLINEAHQLGLKNLKVYMADANDVLAECLPDESIDRFQLYFPDPWHKKKHNKRRIVQPEFLRLISSKLKPGGILHMATDWQPYAEQMLELLEQFEGLENTSTAGNGAQSGYCPRPEFRPETKFERRGERLGHGVWDLLFIKQ